MSDAKTAAKAKPTPKVQPPEAPAIDPTKFRPMVGREPLIARTIHVEQSILAAWERIAYAWNMRLEDLMKQSIAFAMEMRPTADAPAKGGKVAAQSAGANDAAEQDKAGQQKAARRRRKRAANGKAD